MRTILYTKRKANYLQLFAIPVIIDELISKTSQRRTREIYESYTILWTASQQFSCIYYSSCLQYYFTQFPESLPQYNIVVKPTLHIICYFPSVLTKLHHVCAYTSCSSLNRCGRCWFITPQYVYWVREITNAGSFNFNFRGQLSTSTYWSEHWLLFTNDLGLIKTGLLESLPNNQSRLEALIIAYVYLYTCLEQRFNHFNDTRIHERHAIMISVLWYLF